MIGGLISNITSGKSSGLDYVKDTVSGALGFDDSSQSIDALESKNQAININDQSDGDNSLIDAAIIGNNAATYGTNVGMAFGAGTDKRPDLSAANTSKVKPGHSLSGQITNTSTANLDDTLDYGEYLGESEEIQLNVDPLSDDQYFQTSSDQATKPYPTPSVGYKGAAEPGRSGGFGAYRGPWSPEVYEKHEKERKDWTDAGDFDKWIDEEKLQWEQGQWKERQRLAAIKKKKAEATGKVLQEFSDAFRKIRSDSRDPYTYSEQSIFGGGLNL